MFLIKYHPEKKELLLYFAVGTFAIRFVCRILLFFGSTSIFFSHRRVVWFVLTRISLFYTLIDTFLWFHCVFMIFFLFIARLTFQLWFQFFYTLWNSSRKKIVPNWSHTRRTFKISMWKLNSGMYCDTVQIWKYAFGINREKKGEPQKLTIFTKDADILLQRKMYKSKLILNPICWNKTLKLLFVCLLAWLFIFVCFWVWLPTTKSNQRNENQTKMWTKEKMKRNGYNLANIYYNLNETFTQCDIPHSFQPVSKMSEQFNLPACYSIYFIIYIMLDRFHIFLSVEFFFQPKQQIPYITWAISISEIVDVCFFSN